MRRLLDRLGGARADGGIALPTTIILGAVLMAFVATGLSTATSGLQATTTDQNSTRASDAAYAGVQDYLSRLNADGGYAGYGNGAARFSSGSALATPTTANPAFGLGAAGTWATVADGTASVGACPPSTTPTPCFRYEVDNRQFTASGIVRLRSTGRYAQSTSSIVATIKRQGFVNFLYFTDYETQDPVVSGNSTCVAYAWQATRDPDGTCTIRFAATDTLSGPLHTNDTPAVCGTLFKAQVTTANPKTPVVVTPAGCAQGRYDYPGGKPISVAKIEMPATNTGMRAQTRSDLVNTTGCLYTGPTVVQYLGDGRMTVWSPWTKYTNITASTTTGSNPAKCGTPGTGAGQLGSSAGATVAELDQNLLYVQTVPGSGDPNYSATTTLPNGVTCIGSDGRTSVQEASSSVGWKFGPWAFPTTGEAAPDGWDANAGIGNWSGTGAWSTSLPAYNCRNGDLFVSGTYTTQTTAASDDYVYVIGNVLAKDKTQDVLGLVGNNAVLVWNPVNASNAALLTGTASQRPDGSAGREIDASLLSVAHTFQVQNYNRATSRGTLSVFGSIAQKFRGPVATSSNGSLATGYAKDYQYASLLGTVTPPYFLAPSSTTFAIRLYASVPTAFQASGEYR